MQDRWYVNNWIASRNTTTPGHRRELAKRVQDLEEHRGLPQPQRIIITESHSTDKHPHHTHISLLHPLIF
jgi:hypothetical protein